MTQASRDGFIAWVLVAMCACGRSPPGDVTELDTSDTVVAAPSPPDVRDVSPPPDVPPHRARDIDIDMIVDLNLNLNPTLNTPSTPPTNAPARHNRFPLSLPN